MKAFAIFPALFLLAACSSTQVKTYDDGGATYIGRGGAKETVDGVEIWTQGAPPRAYKILAVIEDERPKAVIPMAKFKDMIVERTKKAGGNAAIVRMAGSEPAGTLYIPGGSTTTFNGTIQPTYAGSYQATGTATTYSTPGYAMQTRRHVAVIDVIRYVTPDDILGPAKR